MYLKIINFHFHIKFKKEINQVSSLKLNMQMHVNNFNTFFYIQAYKDTLFAFLLLFIIISRLVPQMNFILFSNLMPKVMMQTISNESCLIFGELKKIKIHKPHGFYINQSLGKNQSQVEDVLLLRNLNLKTFISLFLSHY